MNRVDALVELNTALDEHLPVMEKRLLEAANFVDYVGAGRLYADLLDVAVGVEWGIICTGTVKISENLSLSFVDGVLVSASDYGQQADSPFKSFFASDDPRREATEILLKLRGVPESIFEVYQVDFGQRGCAPEIKGVNSVTDASALSLPVLDVVRWMVEEELLDSLVQLVLEDAAVDVLMEDLVTESPVWSDQLVKDNEEWL